MARRGTPRRRRLSRSGDFDRVFRDGRSYGNRYLVVYGFARAEEANRGPRLGISVARKVGGAVERNAVKRAVREGFWQLADATEGRDVVIIARPEVARLVEDGGTPAVVEQLAPLLQALAAGRST